MTTSRDDVLLAVEGLSVAYPQPGQRTSLAVDNVSFTVGRGEFVAIVGESGSGKTTTARAVLGLLPQAATVTGQIDFDGTSLLGLASAGWREVRGKRLAYVPQDPTVSLNPTKRIGRQLAEAITIHEPRIARPVLRQRVIELLDTVGIAQPGRRSELFPHELSGGMRQRVLIAAALAHSPALIVADEPTSALDVTVQKQLLDHLDQLRSQLGVSMLLITHDIGVAGERADRIVVLSDGTVVEHGTPASVLSAPRAPYTRMLVAAVPRIDTRITRRPPAVLTGADARSPEGHPSRANTAQRSAGAGVASDATQHGAAGSATPLLIGSGLTKRFRSAGDWLTAVDGVDVRLHRGATLGVVGESGSGKSTLARLLARLTPADGGSISVDGTDITTLRGEALRQVRTRIQMVYQNPYASLDPRFTIARSLAEPLRAFRIGDRASRRRRAAELLDAVGLPTAFLDRLPAQLSGGQLQRVAIARALANDPELVILDEAVSALDVSVQAQILDLLAALQEERGISYLFISHDLAVIRQISDDIIVMHHGRAVEAGPADDVFSAPRSPYTVALLDAIPRIVTGPSAPAAPASAAVPSDLLLSPM